MVQYQFSSLTPTTAQQQDNNLRMQITAQKKRLEEDTTDDTTSICNDVKQDEKEDTTNDTTEDTTDDTTSK